MRVLLIEDDIHLCEILKFELESEGYTVDICNDGEEGLHYIRQKAHDVVLLDQMLPLLSGREVLKITRKEQIHTPVILVTALGESADKIQGLDSGADDYIVKPFDSGELLARLRSVLRRPGRIVPSDEIRYGSVSYFPSEKKLLIDGIPYELTNKEGDLLEIFLKHPEKILNRQSILAKVWGPAAEIEDGNLDNYIYLLRKRLMKLKCPLEITTKRGIGYSLVKKNV